MSLFLHALPRALFPTHLFSIPLLRFLSDQNQNPSSRQTHPILSPSDHFIIEVCCFQGFPTIQFLQAKRFRASYFNTTDSFKFLSEDPTSLLLPPSKPSPPLALTSTRRTHSTLSLHIFANPTTSTTTSKCLEMNAPLPQPHLLLPHPLLPQQ